MVEAGISSGRERDLCEGWWAAIGVSSEIVASVDSTIGDLSDLELALDYPGVDPNLDRHDSSAYVALCVIAGESADVVDAHDFLIMYFLDDPQDNGIIFIS